MLELCVQNANRMLCYRLSVQEQALEFLNTQLMLLVVNTQPIFLKSKHTVQAFCRECTAHILEVGHTARTLDDEHTAHSFFES